MQRKILIVDDEKDIIELLSEHFNLLNYQVFTAFTGDEALSLYQNNVPFDIVLTDVRMPGKLDGFQLIAEVVKSEAPLPVCVIMSGHADAIPDKYKEEAVYHLIAKPFTTVQIAELIDRAYIEVGRDDINPIRSPRYQAKVDAKLEFSGAQHEAYTENISSSGAFIVINGDELPKINSKFELIIDKNHERKFNAQCVVRWIRYEKQESFPAGIGCEFVDVDSQNQANLNFLLNEIKIRV